MNVDQMQELSDDIFRDLVNRELRKDHPAVLAGDPEEKAYLESLSLLLRDPIILPRWITVLEVMKHSAETQLGSRRADVKKMHGTVSDEKYLELWRTYQSSRASNLRFLHTVQARLIQAKAMQVAEERVSTNLAKVLIHAIENHRMNTLAEYDDPDEQDEILWNLISTADPAV